MRFLDNRSLTFVTFLLLLATSVVIGVTIVIGVVKGHPESQFGEGRLATFVSAAQLFWIGWLALQMKRIRHTAPDRTFWKPSTAIWGMMSIGFFYLAADELIQIHEFVDKATHYVFRIEETNITDRFDDVIVGLYGVVGLAAIIAYRQELMRHRRAWPFLAFGFLCGFLSVAFDLLTSRNDILRRIFDDKDRDEIRTLHSWFAVAEDSLKLYAVTFFVLAMYMVVRRTRAELANSGGQAHAAATPVK